MTFVVIALDDQAADFLRLALETRRRSTGRLPDGLLLAKGGQGRTSLGAGAGPGDHADVTKLLSKTRADAELGVSTKTVQRLTGSGRLPTVKVEGRSMVRRADLEAYVAELSPVEASA